jgi:hypothetical protein
MGTWRTMGGLEERGPGRLEPAGRP